MLDVVLPGVPPIQEDQLGNGHLVMGGHKRRATLGSPLPYEAVIFGLGGLCPVIAQVEIFPAQRDDSASRSRVFAVLR